MLTVGLTGGIASGKTTVAKMFRARGCRVVDADHLSHAVIRPGQPAYAEVVRAFGPEVVGADGVIDRGRVAGIVFADRRRLDQLNQIVHPHVIAAIENEFARLRREEPGAIVLLEAALLVESGYDRHLDKLVVTWCRPEQQVERLVRNFKLSRAQAEKRVAAQLPAEEKRLRADYEIDCSGSLQVTEEQVERILGDLQRLAGLARR